MRAATRPSEPRLMTTRDWQALHLLHRLSEQVVLHGEQALHAFMAHHASTLTPVSPEAGAQGPEAVCAMPLSSPPEQP
jgi:hypothetical protein